MSDGAGPFIVDAVEALRRRKQTTLVKQAPLERIPYFDGPALKDTHRVRRALASGATIALPANLNLAGLRVGEDCGCNDLHCAWEDMGDRVLRDCWPVLSLSELLRLASERLLRLASERGSSYRSVKEQQALQRRAA
jgi:hypothetical protein